MIIFLAQYSHTKKLEKNIFYKDFFSIYNMNHGVISPSLLYYYKRILIAWLTYIDIILDIIKKTWLIVYKIIIQPNNKSDYEISLIINW